MHIPAAGVAAIAVVVAIATSACGAATDVDGASGTPTSPVSAAPPEELSASLVQYRRDQAEHQVQVKLANAGDEVLAITLVDVTLHGYGPTGAVDRTTTLRGHRRVDLPVPLGSPRCDGAVDGGSHARVAVTDASGRTVRASLPIDDAGLLARLRRFDCAVQRADDVVAITLDPSWTPRGDGDARVVDGRAAVTLRDRAARVEITAVTGNLLFVVEPGAVAPAPPVRLDAARAAATLAFAAVPSRCDGHAIAEARRLTSFGFVMSVDGAEPVTLRRTPDEAGYDVLLRALTARCAHG